MLPQIIANKQRADDLARQEVLNTEQKRQWAADFRLAKRGQRQSQRMAQRQHAQAQREQRVGMGLEGVKLGTSIMSNLGGPGGMTIGKAKGQLGFNGGTAMTGGINDINIGGMVGAGLAGAGAAQMLGGKKKRSVKKSAIGAGAGALLGYLGGGGIGGAIGSGALGGIGSLF
jgi:hypothetical protein